MTEPLSGSEGSWTSGTWVRKGRGFPPFSGTWPFAFRGPQTGNATCRPGPACPPSLAVTSGAPAELAADRPFLVILDTPTLVQPPEVTADKRAGGAGVL